MAFLGHCVCVCVGRIHDQDSVMNPFWVMLLLFHSHYKSHVVRHQKGERAMLLFWINIPEGSF